MSVLIDRILPLVGEHQLWAYGFVGLLAAAESLPIVGAVIPGTVIILGIAALVPSGAVAFWPVLLSAIAGAVLGDGFAFWLGHRYSDSIGQWRWLERHPQLMVEGRRFFERHGGKSILLARFTPGVRAVVPLVAGLAGMPFARFYLINVLSAVLWAASHILPAVAVGASIALAGAVGGRLAILLVVAGLTLWLLVFLARRGLQLGLPLLDRGLDALWRWSSAHDSWLARRIAAFLHPHREAFPTLLLLAAIIVAAGWAFLGVLEDVVSGDPLVAVDMAVYHFFQGLRSPWSDHLLITVTELGDGVVTTAVTAVVTLWLLWRGRRRAAAYLVAAVAFAGLIEVGLKATLRISRPIALYHGLSAFSFPSGHATVNTALYAFLAFLIARELPARARPAIIGAATLLAGAIAFSRVYLGAHWLADVLAGVTLSLTWVAILGIAYMRRETGPPVRPYGLIAVVLASLVIAGSVNVALHQKRDVIRYAVSEETRMLSPSAWWNGGWQSLPARRRDAGGEAEEPVTLQWAGGLPDLERQLIAAGWREPQPWSLGTTLSWLNPGASIGDLPVLPQLDTGRLPALTLVRPEADASRRLVLRLWPSGVLLHASDGNTVPLWLGAVVVQRLARAASLLTLTREQPDVNGPRQQLAAAFPQTKTVERAGQQSPGRWDGRLLLAHASTLLLARWDDRLPLPIAAGDFLPGEAAQLAQNPGTWIAGHASLVP